MKRNNHFMGSRNQSEDQEKSELRQERQETPDWILAEDVVAAFFRRRGFRVEQQVKVGSGGIIDLLALWRRAHEKHHFLVECKDRRQFARADEKSLVRQLHRYLTGYTKTRLSRERGERRHIIILLGICTNTYHRPHRQISFKWNPQQLSNETGRRVHAIRCYITTPPNLKIVLHDARIPAGLQNKLS